MSLRAYLRGIGIGMIVTALILTVSSGKNTISDSEIRARAKELGMVQGNELLIGTEVSKNSVSKNSADDSDNITIRIDDKDQKESSGSEKSEKNASDTSKSSSVSSPGVSKNGSSNENSRPKVTFSDERSPAVESVADTVNAASSASQPRSTAITDKEDNKTPTEAKGTANDSSATAGTAEDSAATAGSSSGQSSSGTAGTSSAPATSGETFVLHISRGESSYAAAKALEEAGIVDSAVAFDKYLVSQGIDRRIDAGDHVVPRSGTYEEIGQALLQ